jgi:GNAT superfamily N-acetyltransferase
LRKEPYKESDFGEFDDHPWLTVLVGVVSTKNGKEIGRVTAQLIKRPIMRANFHSDMDEPDEELQDLGWTLFDKRGYFKDEYWKHPVMKGSGVWGEELGEGKFLYIRYIKVHDEWRKQGVATKLVEGLLKLASEEVSLLFSCCEHFAHEYLKIGV